VPSWQRIAGIRPLVPDLPNHNDRSTSMGCRRPISTAPFIAFERGLVRRVPALLIAAGLLAATLTGCSSAANADCGVQAGDASKLVSVTGAFGKKHTLDFPTPLDSATLQRSNLKQGTGVALQPGQSFDAMITLGNGATGESSGAAKGLFVISKNQYPGLSKSLQCVTVGSRVVVTGPAKTIFGADEATQIGFDPTATAVAAVDVTRAFLARANGTPQPSQSGFPTVVLAPDGRPGIKVPTTPAPKSVKAETLKKGSGATVKKGDIIIANYTQVQWSDNTVAGSSWQQGSPVAWSVGGSTAQGATAAPSGLKKSLIGSQVGSQLVVLVPADAKAGTTASAYVIDVLGIA